jgi:cellulose synthase/poly-beta-1,6-N-acetylglucosamine synthase-like glycosyltransferase
MDGDFILFWDSDVIPPKDLLKQIVNMLESNNKVGIIGADYESLYEHGDLSTRILGAPITNKATHAVYMGFTLIRKEIFERVGGFNELLNIGEDTEICIRVVEKTDYKIMWAPRPVLHLESVGETERFKQGFLPWLSYNFQSRGEQYAKSLHKLPLLLRFRVFYYALLPPVLISLLFLTYSTGAIWMPLLFIAYLLPGLSLAVHSSNIKRGVILFFKLNIPTGVALSYGVLTYFFKKLLGR